MLLKNAITGKSYLLTFSLKIKFRWIVESTDRIFNMDGKFGKLEMCKSFSFRNIKIFEIARLLNARLNKK